MTTIELEDRTVSAIQAIWDYDHGTRNEGWYLRTRFVADDGGWTEEDDTNCPIADLPRNATDAKIVAEVSAWLYDVEGMTGDARQQLRGMIEVKR